MIAMTKLRRSSYISSSPGSSTSGASESSHSDNLLSTRTRKSISKSRRSSVVDGGLDRPAPTASTRRASLVVVAAISLLSSDLTKMDDPYSPDNNSLPADTIDVDHSNGQEDDIDKLTHQSYKIKMKKTSRKLDSFFGETAPIDVCIREIRKEGVKAMLESKVPQCYFLHYLLSEYSSENLFFYLEVEQFENKQSLTIPEQLEYAQKLFNRYISGYADFEINLEDRVKRNIKNMMKINTTSPSTTTKVVSQYQQSKVATSMSSIFSEAKASVYVLLEASFMRFLQSNMCRDMMKYCGEYTIHYNERTTRRAIQNLSDYLRKQQQNLYRQHQQHTQYEMSKRYLHILQNAIEKFIESLFGPEYLTKIVFNKLQ